MATKFDNILGTIGNTPLVRLSKLAPAHVNVFAKLEAFNPMGSVKDRLALGIIEDAERRLYELAEVGRYGGGFQKFETALTTAVDMAARAYQREGKLSGLATGLKDLDSKMGGLQSSDLIIVAGRPGMGKTALATNVAYNVARAWRGEVRADGHIDTVNGGIAGRTAADYCAEIDLPAHDTADIAAEQARVLAPTRREDGLTPYEMEFKTRRLVNDYLQPPKITAKINIGQERLAEVRADLDQLVVRDPHELMRALETQSILDCADLAAAASLYRTESRWGLYHLRVDYPETDNDNWFCHSMHYKDARGRIAHRKREVAPYIVPVAADEMSAYHHLRIKTPVAAE